MEEVIPYIVQERIIKLLWDRDQNDKFHLKLSLKKKLEYGLVNWRWYKFSRNRYNALYSVSFNVLRDTVRDFKEYLGSERCKVKEILFHPNNSNVYISGKQAINKFTQLLGSTLWSLGVADSIEMLKIDYMSSDMPVQVIDELISKSCKREKLTKIEIPYGYRYRGSTYGWLHLTGGDIHDTNRLLAPLTSLDISVPCGNGSVSELDTILYALPQFTQLKKLLLTTKDNGCTLQQYQAIMNAVPLSVEIFGINIQQDIFGQHPGAVEFPYETLTRLVNLKKFIPIGMIVTSINILRGVLNHPSLTSIDSSSSLIALSEEIAINVFPQMSRIKELNILVQIWDFDNGQLPLIPTFLSNLPTQLTKFHCSLMAMGNAPPPMVESMLSRLVNIVDLSLNIQSSHFSDYEAISNFIKHSPTLKSFTVDIGNDIDSENDGDGSLVIPNSYISDLYDSCIAKSSSLIRFRAEYLKESRFDIMKRLLGEYLTNQKEIDQHVEFYNHQTGYHRTLEFVVDRMHLFQLQFNYDFKEIASINDLQL